MLDDPAFKPAMMILDLSLPLLSGFEVLERNPRKNLPVVIFSAAYNEADVERAKELGAREYIQKTMDLGDYRSAILGMIAKWTTPEKQANGAASS